MEMLSCSDANLERAARALASGLIVAFPTETVYGLGADAFNTAALARVFEAKNRPAFDPLIVHIADIDSLTRIADTASLGSVGSRRLAILTERFWPGPLTVILPKQKAVPDLVTSGLPTVAVRFPSHPVAQKLIRLSTGAIAAPSANPFGFLSPTRADHVRDQLGNRVDFIVDGGKTELGLESTVVDLTSDLLVDPSGVAPIILRQGSISIEEIEAVIGPVRVGTSELPASSGKPNSPGQLKSHYAPGIPLFLHEHGELACLLQENGEGRLYFCTPKNIPSLNNDISPEIKVLSLSGDLIEAAANFFDMLHELNALDLKLIRAEEAPGYGLGLAINDRLRRAASIEASS
ncbi:MAG: L-threonylcarbamoyladenylate synthase [Treponema sp.]|nr:L-threonylcarbamoyladenylate synthase [Treponema sp.]